MLSTSFNFIAIALFFVFSCCIGSFLNVLIDRIPREESVTKGRSHCDSCYTILKWYDLFPVFSFLLLRAKCRYCRKEIGWQAVVVELLTGIVFLYTAYFYLTAQLSFFSSLSSLVIVLFILGCFITIAVIDIKHGIIPNRIVYPGILVLTLYHLFSIHTFPSYFFSAIGAGSFFIFLFVITKGRGMGFGDVKLAFLLGMFLGFPGIIIALYIAFLTGALVAFILVLLRKKKFSGGTIPFGPFLIFGAVIALFFGSFFWNHLFFLFLKI